MLQQRLGFVVGLRVVQMMMSMPQNWSTLSKLISGNTMCSFRPMA
jgi:hypothetical protein